ncbi:hypothetical protein AAG906_013242 [Vitis piasezkii]
MKQGKVKDKKNDNDGEDDRVATTTSDFLIVYDSDVVNFACQETSWVIDSGASIHATPRKDFFTSYTSDDFGTVMMARLKPLVWEIGSMVVAKGKKCSSLYLMQARVIDSNINAVDDDSIHTELHSKHTAIEGSRYFHALVERQSGEKLKCIWTDNGGEYFGPFDEYCRQHGIRHQKTPSKTPQLNGLDELGYRFYDPVQKKLVRSRDAMFMEDHTIQDIEKTDATKFQYSDNLIDLDPVPLTHFPTQVEDEAYDVQLDIGGVETPTG